MTESVYKIIELVGVSTEIMGKSRRSRRRDGSHDTE